MIFILSKIIKEKLKEKNIYNKETYENYFRKYIYIISYLIKEYADTINERFIDLLLKSKNIDIGLYLINSEFKIKDIIGFCIYSNTGIKKEKIYLLLFCIKKTYRKFGYGKTFLEEFIEYMKIQNKQKIITHSIDESIKFYKFIGFIISNKIYNYKKIFEFEKYNKNAKILELIL